MINLNLSLEEKEELDKAFDEWFDVLILLPCPFCAGGNLYVEKSIIPNDSVSISCEDCCLVFSPSSKECDIEVPILWNTRPSIENRKPLKKVGKTTQLSNN